MFEGCVEMGFLLKTLDVFEMLVVDMRVDPEKAFQNGLRDGEEVFWKGHT